MKISRLDYDQKPLAIRHGALLLWGTPLSSHSDGALFCQLYKFNDFQAMICKVNQRVTCICTVSA